MPDTACVCSVVEKASGSPQAASSITTLGFIATWVSETKKLVKLRLPLVLKISMPATGATCHWLNQLHSCTCRSGALVHDQINIVSWDAGTH